MIVPIHYLHAHDVRVHAPSMCITCGHSDTSHSCSGHVQNSSAFAKAQRPLSSHLWFLYVRVLAVSWTCSRLIWLEFFFEMLDISRNKLYHRLFKVHNEHTQFRRSDQEWVVLLQDLLVVLAFREGEALTIGKRNRTHNHKHTCTRTHTHTHTHAHTHTHTHERKETKDVTTAVSELSRKLMEERL